MNMKKTVSIIAAVVLASSAGLAQAATALKIGVVDLPVVLQQAPQVAVINEKLKTQFAPQQKQIMELQTKIRGEVSKLSGSDASKLSADDKKKIQDTVSSDQKELQAQVMKLQESLAKAQSEEMQKFIGEIDTASASIASKQGLDLVVLKQAVLYPAGTDVTKDVIAELPKK